MRQNDNGGVCRDRDLSQQADELPHLRAVDLVAGENVGRSVEADHAGPDIAGRFLELGEQGRRLDQAMSVGVAKHGVLAD